MRMITKMRVTVVEYVEVSWRKMVPVIIVRTKKTRINMSKKIKVRFNLGRGENYMKWKVEYPNGYSKYFTPTENQLILKGCQLKNSRTTALKILRGEHKVVCAWVLCDEIEIIQDNFIQDNQQQVKYNPRVLPYWNKDGMDMDGSKINMLYTIDYKLNIRY
jgi:hypothetical protein